MFSLYNSQLLRCSVYGVFVHMSHFSLVRSAVLATEMQYKGLVIDTQIVGLLSSDDPSKITDMKKLFIKEAP